MMRAAVAGALTVLMGLGYFASQAAYFQQNTKSYINAIDASPVRWLSLILLVGVVVLAFIPDREAEQE